MPKHHFWQSISIFESGLSAAEWLWRIITIVFIGGGGLGSAFLAKADPILGALGPLYWVIVGVLVSFAIALIFFLVKSAILKQSEADLNRALAVPRNFVNPLSESFKDAVIPVEELRLPKVQLHENKHFKRCTFVGPAAIAIIGGNYIRTGFADCGDIVALPENSNLTGIVVLKNCTVEDCQFVRTSIFTDQGSARGFTEVPGASVRGLNV